VAILVALAFGSWMWGIVGALISVPLLVVVKVFCDNFPSLATFGDFLSGEAPPVEIVPASDAAAQTHRSARLRRALDTWCVAAERDAPARQYLEIHQRGLTLHGARRGCEDRPPSAILKPPSRTTILDTHRENSIG